MPLLHFRLVLVLTIASIGCASADGNDDPVDSSSPASSSDGTPTTSDASATSPASSTVSDGPSSGDDGEFTTAADDSEGSDGGSDSGEPTGDVWVDAAGTVLGLSRTLADFRDDAVAGLITPDGASWQVVDDGQVQKVVALDRFLANSFYASMDCSGPPMFASGYAYDAIRSTIVTSAFDGDGSEVAFVVPEGVEPTAAEFASWVGEGGCFYYEHSDPPAALYRAEDILLVDPPAFVAPLVVEYH